jgi:hypothetical protein
MARGAGPCSRRGRPRARRTPRTLSGRATAVSARSPPRSLTEKCQTADPINCERHVYARGWHSHSLNDARE